MLKTILLLTCFSFIIVLCGCPTAGVNGFTLTIRIENVPVSADGHIVKIYIIEDMGESMFQQTGYSNTNVTGTYIETIIKEYKLIGGERPDTKYYDDNASCRIEIYIDMDGNGDMNDTGDVSDAITHSVIINGNTVKVIDFTTLNI